MKCLTVLIQKLNTYFGPDQTILHFLLNELLHPALQVVWKILNDCQDFLNRGAFNDLLDEVIVRLIVVCVDVNFGHTAKEIVNIPKDVLIRAHQKESQIVRHPFDERMQL